MSRLDDVGTTFTMQLPWHVAINSTMIAVKPYEGFMDEVVVDETRVLTSHKLASLPSGKTRIIYSTEMTRPGAAEFAALK